MSLSESMIEESKTQSTRFLSQGNELPLEMISAAEKKLFGFQEVKSEIDGKMQKVHGALEDVRQTVRQNIHSQKSGAGFLTQGEAAYLACLELKHVQLEELFRKDEQRLTKNVEFIKRQAEDLKEKVKELLERQNEELAQMLNISARLIVKGSCSLRKLPFWGKAADNQFNFEWPTKEQFQQMPEDVRLQSLEFKCDDSDQP